MMTPQNRSSNTLIAKAALKKCGFEIPPAEETQNGRASVSHLQPLPMAGCCSHQDRR